MGVMVRVARAMARAARAMAMVTKRAIAWKRVLAFWAWGGGISSGGSLAASIGSPLELDQSKYFLQLLRGPTDLFFRIS
jgi:hypothetical protein